jgi:hypothetical protein
MLDSAGKNDRPNLELLLAIYSVSSLELYGMHFAMHLLVV